MVYGHIRIIKTICQHVQGPLNTFKHFTSKKMHFKNLLTFSSKDAYSIFKVFIMLFSNVYFHCQWYWYWRRLLSIHFIYTFCNFSCFFINANLVVMPGQSCGSHEVKIKSQPGEIFGGNSTDICTKKNLLTFMGGWVEGLAWILIFLWVRSPCKV